jgi:hypothetical protein
VAVGQESSPRSPGWSVVTSSDQVAEPPVGSVLTQRAPTVPLGVSALPVTTHNVIVGHETSSSQAKALGIGVGVQPVVVEAGVVVVTTSPSTGPTPTHRLVVGHDTRRVIMARVNGALASTRTGYDQESGPPYAVDQSAVAAPGRPSSAASAATTAHERDARRLLPTRPPNGLPADRISHRPRLCVRSRSPNTAATNPKQT